MKRLLWIAAVLFWARCASSPDESMSSSSVLVDLGDGNGEAISAYNDFDASRCGNATSAVMAFKSFDGKKNVTQTGAETLVASSQRQEKPEAETQSFEGTNTGIDQPQGQELGTEKPTAEVDRQAGESGMLLTADGVDVDVVEVDGESTCIIRAPVNLHSPAIARKIAERGTVRSFYMTGQRSGQGIVEEGAYNNIGTNHDYYDANGQRIAQRNTSNRVDEGREHNTAVSSSFDQKAIAGATGINAANGPRSTNDYICNATNYVLSQQGELQYLPGLTFGALKTPVRTGFVHVPDTASADEVARVMRETMRADRASAAKAH